ncbi:MAG: hypothetical protein ACXVZO_07795 [Gaiellaceae bacterium]
MRLLALLLLVGSSSPWAAAARSVSWQVYAPRDSAGLRLEGIDSLPCQPGARLLTATYRGPGGKVVSISEGRRLCSAANFGHNRWLLVRRLHGIRVQIGAGCYRAQGRCRIEDGVRNGYWVLWTQPGQPSVRILMVAGGTRFATVWRLARSMEPLTRR